MRFFDDKILCVTYGIILLMAAYESPYWMTGVVGLLVLWKWGSERGLWPKMSRAVTGVLSALLVVQVYLQYGTLLGQEPSNTLLLGLSGLKIMDYEDRRDHLFLILLGFILVSTKAVFTIDVYWAVPSFAALLGLWYVLMSESMKRKWVYLLKMAVISAPLTVALFVVFPRVVVPWAMSQANVYGQAGFSDSLRPGGVAELATSDSLAFRVRFDGPRPAVDELYWRGSVLTDSRNLDWGRLGYAPSESLNFKPLPGPRYSYEVVLEPNPLGYLFFLGTPQTLDAPKVDLGQFPYGIVRSLGRLEKATPYAVTSSLGPSGESVNESEMLQVIPLPPKANSWVQKVIVENPDLNDRLAALKALYVDHDFTYTLKPGVYSGPEPLDEFLFDRRRGFCEHFAGSYATLARALGIPARVVLGYQGGEYNPLGDFWKITQRDAHAWVEIYVNDQWRQIDPTEWIAPLRIQLGANDFFGLSEEEQKLRTGFDVSRLQGETLYDQLTLWIDDFNYRWTYFLLEFNIEKQRLWLQSFFNNSKFYGLLGFGFAALSLIAVAALRRRRKFAKPAERVVTKFFEKEQFDENSHIAVETPLQFLQRMSRRYPESSSEIEKLAGLYDQEAYVEKELTRADRGELAQIAKSLRLS